MCSDVRNDHKNIFHRTRTHRFQTYTDDNFVYVSFYSILFTVKLLHFYFYFKIRIFKDFSVVEINPALNMSFSDFTSKGKSNHAVHFKAVKIIYTSKTDQAPISTLQPNIVLDCTIYL